MLNTGPDRFAKTFDSELVSRLLRKNIFCCSGGGAGAKIK